MISPFIGEYPIAFVEYAQKKQELPVRVSAEFYSPFIPLDAKSSANSSHNNEIYRQEYVG